MSDWPAVSMRTRAFEVIAVGTTIAQCGIVVTSPPAEAAPAVANVLGIFVVSISLAMIAWAIFALHGRAAPPRLASALLIMGASLRVWTLLPVTYRLQDPPVAIPPPLYLYVLAFSYVVVVLGYLATAISYSRGVSVRQALTWSVTGSLSVGVLFALAAFAPIPDTPTVLTNRDQFAIALLAIDVTMLGLASYITFVNLQRPIAAMSRGWLWIAVGELLLAMGDCVWPILTTIDAAKFASLLWGLGYALFAAGASIMLDVVDAQEGRTRPLDGLLVQRADPDPDL